ncbi:hypothetical protein DSECCO2_461410 [anaerobic digester metagenome]
MKDAVIRVQGRGEAGAEPDLVVLSFQASGRSGDYADAVARATRSVESLRGTLEEHGVARTALKTVQFGVETDYEWDSDHRERRFRGYVATHALRLVLDRTHDAGKVLHAIAAGAPGVEVRVSFEVGDRRGFRQRLLAAAVEAAHENAATIARAAGVRLGPVLGIEYGWTEVRYSSSLNVDTMELSRLAAPVISFEPDEVRGEETVTLTCAIDGSVETAR